MKTAFALLLSAAMLIGGCAKKKETKPSDDFAAPLPPPPTYTSEAMREALIQADQSLKVGQINSVDTRAQTAAVANVLQADFKAGDIMTIVDLTQAPVATGSVIAVGSDMVTVKYTIVAGGRIPRDGDLAIKFTK